MTIHPSFPATVREYAPGIGKAVADRTVNRLIEKPLPNSLEFVTFTIPRDDSRDLNSQVAAWAKSNGYAYHGYHVNHGDGHTVEVTIYATGRLERETWGEVAQRVALGNAALYPPHFKREFDKLHRHISQASLLMSGRHLQHGDMTQPSRNMEVFTNCSTSGTSFLLFTLLLNGSGVGTDYSDHMQITDWSKMPIVVPVIDMSHGDVATGEIIAPTRRDAEHMYAGLPQIVHEVEDSREGWGKAVELIERLTFEGTHRNTVLILDFTKVRKRGEPIRGMQNRPSSGPGPLMAALNKVAKVRDAGMEPWRGSMFIDHFLAECVLVGGARRAARMATKWWRDPSVLGFIELKRGGFLWSSNNSVLVDATFWRLVKAKKLGAEKIKAAEADLAEWAVKVFDAVLSAAYNDMTGEPGFINVDRLAFNPEGIEGYLDGDYAKSAKYQVDEPTRELMKAKARALLAGPYHVITNPCGEIVLLLLGGYCVIADVVPYFAENDDDAEDAFRTATRALIRTNLMDSLYKREVQRTNRIGVGFTGIFEFALKRFGFGWKDLVDEQKSLDFWKLMGRFSRAVKDEAKSYATAIGVTIPHTDTTVKPAGTTSKLFGLTEGAHLPPMREYLRWVQFRNDDPLVADYEAKGYPVMRLKSYSGTTVVGFPTIPEIIALADKLGLRDKIVTAGEATPEEQFEWLRLLEKWWIKGGPDMAGDTGNQVSYTLKYDPAVVSFDQFAQTVLAHQSTVKCCSVMPQIDATAFEYQPEEPVTKARFEQIVAALSKEEKAMEEDVDFEHLACENGACPVDFVKEKI